MVWKWQIHKNVPDSRREDVGNIPRRFHFTSWLKHSCVCYLIMGLSCINDLRMSVQYNANCPPCSHSTINLNRNHTTRVRRLGSRKYFAYLYTHVQEMKMSKQSILYWWCYRTELALKLPILKFEHIYMIKLIDYVYILLWILNIDGKSRSHPLTLHVHQRLLSFSTGFFNLLFLLIWGTCDQKRHLYGK